MNNRNLLLLLASIGTCLIMLANIMLSEAAQAQAVSFSDNPLAITEHLNSKFPAAGEIENSQGIYHDTTSTLSTVYQLLLTR